MLVVCQWAHWTLVTEGSFPTCHAMNWASNVFFFLQLGASWCQFLPIAGVHWCAAPVNKLVVLAKLRCPILSATWFFFRRARFMNW